MLSALKPQIHLCDFQHLTYRWPQMALESWSFLSCFRGLAVALEGWGVNLSTSCLHFGSKGDRNGHGYKSSSPVLPLLEGEASWLESFKFKPHFGEMDRWAYSKKPYLTSLHGIKANGNMNSFYVCFFYSIWKYILYVIFSYFLK